MGNIFAKFKCPDSRGPDSRGFTVYVTCIKQLFKLSVQKALLDLDAIERCK